MSRRVPYSEKRPQGLETLRLLLVSSEAPFSLKEPRDQPYAGRPCLRNRRAHERRV
jgi:hypothetical protein